MKAQSVSLSILCDVISEMVITSSIDTGSTLTHSGTHPEYGEVITVQNVWSDEHVLVTL
jgi:hypothetical protein